jgi:Tfp pilus assembly protein PilV
VTGNAYEQALQAGYDQQTADAIAIIQDEYTRNTENLKATLAANGVLDSGVGAQALADLQARSLREVNSAVNDLLLKKTEAMSKAHQQAIDNAFAYAGLDLQIAQYNLDRQRLANDMKQDDNTFAANINDMALRYGISPSRLYDARKQYKAQLAQQGVV